MEDYDELADLYYRRRKNLSRFDYNRDIEVPAMLKLIGDVKNKKILDMGCGFGDHAKKLSSQKFRRLVGLDISRKLIDYARQQKIRGADFFCGDITKQILFPKSYFDIVFASLSVHYVKNLKFLFSEVHRVLKKGGTFCFSTAHPIFNLMHKNSEHVIGYKKNPQGGRTIFGNYFDESKRSSILGNAGTLKYYSHTYETLIGAALQSGFELVDYVDAKPRKSSKKIDADQYRLTTTLPTVVLFKFRKK